MIKVCGLLITRNPDEQGATLEDTMNLKKLLIILGSLVVIYILVYFFYLRG